MDINEDYSLNITPVIEKSSFGAETRSYDSISFELGPQKVDLDIAFAMALIQTSKLSERQLQRAINDWTIHGDQSLAQHLQDAGHLHASEIKELSVLATGKTQSDKECCVAFRERICKILGATNSAVADMKHEPRSTLSQYILLRKFSGGGLGSVWLARDESLNRLVVLKELSSQAALSPIARARFRREAEVTSHLEHPNIVPIYQFGRGDDDEDEPFYAMRYVGKKTLADAITEYHARREEGMADAVELRRLLSFFLSVCQAIAFAHSRNVLHRDLKPENIALGNFGEVVILDWGLAKYTEDSEQNLELFTPEEATGKNASNQTTVFGQVLGTPHYMSPEQAAGRIDNMDERTDVYGLGATLFTILTGYAPHESIGENSSKEIRSSDLYRAIVENPTPSVRKMNPTAGPELNAICAKAMAGTPAARYQSVLDLAKDVESWMAGEITSVYKIKWKSFCCRFLKQHVALLSAFVITAIVIALSIRVSDVREQQSQMQNLQRSGENLSMHFVSSVDEGIQNARFMSTIPPIQGIIDARRATPQVIGVSLGSEEDEVDWEERLETIFTGMVTANPEYVSLSFWEFMCEEEDACAREIILVERNRTDRSYVRSMPTEYLASERYIDKAALSQDVLRAGDVHVGDVYPPMHMRENGEVESPHLLPLTLDLTVPIFDERTGVLFGVVVLRVDVEYLLVVELFGRNFDHVMLANHEGQVLACNQRHDTIENRFVALPGSFLERPETTCLHFPDEKWPNGLFAIKIELDRKNSRKPVILLVEGDESSTRL